MNTISLSPEKALQVLEVCYRMNEPVYLHGPSGVGKTAMIRQLAARLGVHLYAPLILTGYESCDMRGLPGLDHETRRSVWYPPEFLPASDSGVEGILFLDELANAKPELQTPCYQLLQERRIGEYWLPKKTWVCAAGNTEDDDANLFDIQGPLLKRMIVLKIIPDAKSWIEHAVATGVHPAVITFIKTKPENLDWSTQTNKLDTDLIKPNPRAWSEKVSQVLKETSDRLVLESVISGVVGQVTCSELFLTLEEVSSLAPIATIMAVAKDPKRLLPLMPVNEAGIFCMIYSLHALVTNLDEAEDAVRVLNCMASVRDKLPRRELHQVALEMICAKTGVKLKLPIMQSEIFMAAVKNSDFLRGTRNA